MGLSVKHNIDEILKHLEMNRLSLLRNLLFFFTILIIFMFSISLINDEKMGIDPNVEVVNVDQNKVPRMFEHNH